MRLTRARMARITHGFLLLFGLTFLQRVCSEGIIEIKFLYYESGCSDCDPMFTFCVDRPSSTKSVSRRDCSYGVAGETDHYHNTGRVDFGNSIKGVANPWRVRFGTLHEKQIMLVVRTRDDDIFGADHMATWGMTLTETVYPTKGEAKYQTRRMRDGNHLIVFNIMIYCIENFYGWDCSKKCVPRDNANGHYDCDTSTGNKICHTGWTGPNCHIDIDECSLGFCQRGECKNLKGDYYCHCPENYSGRNCSILGDPCESLPCENNGRCMAIENQFNYTCNCSDPWTGQDCEVRRSPCEFGPCLNNGECISNEDNTNFTCTCIYGYEGPLCETKLNLTTTTLQPTTAVGVGANPKGPARITGKDSSEGFLFWHGLLIGLVFLLIIIIIVLFLLFRRRRKEKEHFGSGLPPVHYAEGHLAFENTLYNNAGSKGNSQNNSNGVHRQNVPLPTTPTDDDNFNPIKHVNAFDVNESQGATGGYDEPDEAGYMKPSAIKTALKGQDAEMSESQRAQNNPYSDFRDVKGSQRGDTERVEPHYQDLDEIAIAFQGLDGETKDDLHLIQDKSYPVRGHSPRTTAKLKALANQTLEFNNHNYVSSSASSASDDSDYGKTYNQGSEAKPQENQYSEPNLSASALPGNWNLAGPPKAESAYTDVPSNAPVLGTSSSPPLTLSIGENAYSPIEDEAEFDFTLAQRVSARRQDTNESPYAEPAIPASPLSKSLPSDIPEFKNQLYAEMTAPAQRKPSRGIADDYLHDDEDNIPSFGLPFVDTGYASPPGSIIRNPKEPVYADPIESENVAPHGSNEYASPRSAADPPKSQNIDTSKLRPSTYEEIDQAIPPVPPLPLPSPPPDHNGNHEEPIDTLQQYPYPLSDSEEIAIIADNDGDSALSANMKTPTLFLENHTFIGESEN